MKPSEQAIKAALLKWWELGTIEEAGPNQIGGSWDDPFVVKSLEEMRAALTVAYEIDKR